MDKTSFPPSYFAKLHKLATLTEIKDWLRNHAARVPSLMSHLDATTSLSLSMPGFVTASNDTNRVGVDAVVVTMFFTRDVRTHAIGDLICGSDILGPALQFPGRISDPVSYFDIWFPTAVFTNLAVMLRLNGEI